MQEVPYFKWSPAGNTTLFFPDTVVVDAEKPLLAACAQKEDALGAEQAGFINIHKHTLCMAGGEFCVNATRAFGAHLALAATKDASPDEAGRTMTFSVTVSGWPTPITVVTRGRDDVWDVQARLSSIDYTLRTQETGILQVSLPGITHLLLDHDTFPFSAQNAQNILEEKIVRFRLEQEPCVGAIWWQQNAGDSSITPLVFVRTVKTCFFEKACGSGSLALACMLAETADQQQRTFSILQPSGDPLLLSVDLRERTASVGGRVCLQSSGVFYYRKDI